jgi:hypothetical protein
VQPTEAAPNRALAQYLRNLRRTHWQPKVLVTQKQLGEALGGDRGPLSGSVISSWESHTNPVVPPEHRLAGYARFFASPRSVDSDPARLLDDDELTDEELEAERHIAARIRQLCNPDQIEGPVGAQSPADAVRVLSTGGRIQLGPGDFLGAGTWYFGPEAKRIVIVCARLPEDLRMKMPYARKSDPDYVRAYTYADVDSLIELFAHIRTVNPLADVRIRTDDRLNADDYHSHLVLLGGIDFNPVTRELVGRLNLPVRQSGRSTEEDNGYFEVDGRRYEPVVEVERHGDGTTQRTLLEDVAYFFRGISPMNEKRTITLCNGMFGRGTYGAVRALTDRGFRDRNEHFVAERFGEKAETFSLLFRVTVMAGETLTPDWTVARNRFHEWPDAS